MPTNVAFDPSYAYRQCARRIRGRSVGKPAELYRSLRDLSDRYDSQFAATSKTRRIAPSPADHFVEQIVACVYDGVLSYSDRLDLINAAGDIGIGRFEANLIIASVQHRLGRKTSATSRKPKRDLSGMGLVFAIILVQFSIFAATWALFVR